MQIVAPDFLPNLIKRLDITKTWDLFDQPLMLQFRHRFRFGQAAPVRKGQICRFLLISLIVAVRCASSFPDTGKYIGLQKQKLSPRLERGIVTADVTARCGKTSEFCASTAFGSNDSSIRLILAVSHLQPQASALTSFAIADTHSSRAPPFPG